jgi:hypothetical protein
VNFLFCDGQHKLSFDFGFADEMFRASGFDNTSLSLPGKSEVIPTELLAEAEGIDEGYIASSLIAEAKKPNT